MANRARSSLGGVRNIFADTSFIVALLYTDDSNHALAVEIFRDVAALKIRVVSTWEVVLETVTLLRRRAGYRFARMFVTDVFPEIELILTTESEHLEALSVFLERSRGREISLCDAVSYVIVTTRLSWAPCLSFNSDFAALGLPVVR